MAKFKIPESIIENFITSNFKEAKQTATGQWQFNSPFVQDSKKRLYIDPKKGAWFDQKQQKGGEFAQFVSLYLNINIKDAIPTLLKEYSIKEGNKVAFSEVVSTSKELELPKGLNFFFEKTDGIIYKKAKKYLIGRGIDVENSDLGYIYEPGSPFNNRIFVPFYENGEMVYFIARAFDNNTLRYYNAEGINSGDYVFNIDKIEDEVIICEGVFDALAIYPQVATAILGNKLTKTKVLKILDKDPKRIIFVPDCDEDPKTKALIEKNLELNIKMFMDYKMPSQNIEFYVFRLPEKYKKYKDFSKYSEVTGIHNINIEDCEKYNKKTIPINFRFGRSSF